MKIDNLSDKEKMLVAKSRMVTERKRILALLEKLGERIYKEDKAEFTPSEYTNKTKKGWIVRFKMSSFGNRSLREIYKNNPKKLPELIEGLSVERQKQELRDFINLHNLHGTFPGDPDQWYISTDDRSSYVTVSLDKQFIVE